MSKYIDTDRLREMIAKYQTTAEKAYNPNNEDADFWHGKVVACEDILHIFDSLQQEQPDEQPEYGYLSTEYVPGKKSMWSVGDILAYYISTSNEEGEYTLGKIVDVEFDEYGWFYIFEDGSTSDEESLVEGGAYKKN